MPHQIIVNVPPYEGEYEYDPGSAFSHVEWRWIKKIAGYMPLTIDEGWEGGDPDLMLVLALIAMYRAGKISKREVYSVGELIEDAEVDGAAITIKLEDEGEDEGEADPPESSSLAVLKPDSGGGTDGASELSPESTTQSGTGSPSSEITSPSDRLTLAR